MSLPKVSRGAGDAEISAAVAEYCAGLERSRGGSTWTIEPGSSLYGQCPPYATSADAVLPLLGKISLDGEPNYFRILSPVNEKQGWVVELMWVHHDGDICEGSTKATTFPRAACLALLAASGKCELTP